jgi:hypothetical protein
MGTFLRSQFGKYRNTLSTVAQKQTVLAIAWAAPMAQDCAAGLGGEPLIAGLALSSMVMAELTKVAISAMLLGTISVLPALARLPKAAILELRHF